MEYRKQNFNVIMEYYENFHEIALTAQIFKLCP